MLWWRNKSNPTISDENKLCKMFQNKVMIPEWRKDQEPGQSECWSWWSERLFNESEKIHQKNFQIIFQRLENNAQA